MDFTWPYGHRDRGARLRCGASPDTRTYTDADFYPYSDLRRLLQHYPYAHTYYPYGRGPDILYVPPTFCRGDAMANGQPLDIGDVACGYALETGQRFIFNGVEYVCEDRGRGPYHWVDFWKPTYEVGTAWQADVGLTGTIALLPH